MTARTHDLVLLHGQPGLGADWDGVVAALPERIRAYAPDRPGYGSNPRPGGGLADNARAVLDELDARGIARAALAGHSWGGGVALTVAALAPERVEALILVASAGPGCVTGFDWVFAAPGAGQVLSLLSWELTPVIARAWLRRVARSQPDANVARLHPNIHVWGDARWDHGPIWRTVLREQHSVVRESDGLGLLAPLVSAPALLLADPADKLVPISTSEQLERLLPDATLRLIGGAGHHLPLRAPDRVAAEMTEFLDGLNAPDALDAPPGPAGRRG
jgi:pimeloyl-ACP methyl ester carboxylesterase